MGACRNHQDAKRLPRRVEKVPDLFNTPPASDAGNTGVCNTPPVEKVDDLFNKLEIFATALHRTAAPLHDDRELGRGGPVLESKPERRAALVEPIVTLGCPFHDGADALQRG